MNLNISFFHEGINIYDKGSGPAAGNCGIYAGLWGLQNHTYHSWRHILFAKKSSEKACLSKISVLKQPEINI